MPQGHFLNIKLEEIEKDIKKNKEDKIIISFQLDLNYFLFKTFID